MYVTQHQTGQNLKKDGRHCDRKLNYLSWSYTFFWGEGGGAKGEGGSDLTMERQGILFGIQKHENKEKF